MVNTIFTDYPENQQLQLKYIIQNSPQKCLLTHKEYVPHLSCILNIDSSLQMSAIRLIILFWKVYCQMEFCRKTLCGMKVFILDLEAQMLCGCHDCFVAPTSHFPTAYDHVRAEFERMGQRYSWFQHPAILKSYSYLEPHKELPELKKIIVFT